MKAAHPSFRIFKNWQIYVPRLWRTKRAFVMAPVILAALVAAFFLLLPGQSAEASWFDDAWLYRKAITITNTGGTKTNLQVMLDEVDVDGMNAAGKLQADCDDLRFTDATGAVLNYWVEDEGSASDATVCSGGWGDVDIWVKLPTLPAGGAQIFMYYGNANAPAFQNPKLVFDFFDDFQTFDTTRWTATGAYSNTNGELIVTTGAVYSNAPILAASQGYVYENRTMWTSTAGSYGGMVLSDEQNVQGGNAGSAALAILMPSTPANLIIYGFGSTGTATGYNIASSLTQYTATINTYHISGYSLDTTNLRFYNNRTQTNSYTGTWNLAPYMFFGSFQGSGAGTSDVKDTKTDWVLARQYSFTVSTLALGSEERSPAPVAYWSFDEGNGTTANDAAGGNTGTLTNGPAWKNEEECISGKCLYFDGGDDVVTIANSSSLTLSSSLTISAWVKPSVLNGGENAEVIGLGHGTLNIYWDDTYNKWCAARSGVTMTVCANNTDIETNQWEQITVTHTGTTTVLYKNGIVIGSSSSDSANYSRIAGNPSIGNYYTSGGSLSTGNFHGFIDEVKIYPYARTAAQVKADYAARGTATGVTAQVGSGASLNQGLVAYYSMDESAANTCTGGTNDTCDSSGNTNDGAWNGDTASTAGRYGNGTSFDGTGDYINLPSSLRTSYFTNTSSYTVSTWFKASEVIGGKTYTIFNSVTGTTERTALQIHNSNLVASHRNATDNLLRTAAFTDTSGWHHAVLIYDGTTVNAYLDGVPMTGSASGNTSNAPGIVMGVGANLGVTTFFKGQIDETRIYNRALSPAEARALYNSAPGPVAHWRLDENSGTTAQDTSGNGKVATLTNSASWTAGKVGSGVSLDGTSGYLATGQSLLNGSKAFTLSGWVRPRAGGTRVGFFGQNDVVEFGYNTGTNAQVYINNGSGVSADIGAVPTDAWSYVTATWDGSTLKTYLNGVLKNSAAATGTLTTSSDFFNIGGGGIWDATDNWLNGLIDDVKVYNYARTPEQIAQDMNAAGPSGVALQKPVLHLSFEEGTGTTANDRSGNGNNGTLTNMASPATSTSGWSNDGKVGKALSFDGTNDYVSIPNQSYLTYAADQNASWSLWIKRSSVGGTHVLLSKYTGATGIEINTNPSNQIRFWINNTYLLTSTKIIADTNWHQLLVTMDRSNKTKLYIDGIFDKEASSVTSSTVESSIMRIGANDSGYGFPGLIDELKIYNYALTPEQVNLDFNSGKAAVFGGGGTTSTGTTRSSAELTEYCVPGDTSTCNAPVAEWKLDENTGTAAQDTSGNANTGTLTNGPTWASGKYGSAVKFDGVDDYVNVADASSLDITDAITVGAWVNSSENITGWKRILSKYEPAYDFLFKNASTNELVLYLNNAQVATTGSNAIAPNTWNYVAFTYDKNAGGTTEAKIYVNGQLKGTGDYSTAITTNNEPVNIGRRSFGNPSGTYFPGLIDQVRIYNYARTPAQIAWEYNRGAPVAHYQFDECQGTTIYNSAKTADGQTAGVNGTLVVGATGTNTSAGTCQGTAGQAWKDGATGKVNGSIELDGTNDYISVSDTSLSSAITTANSASFAMWFKPADTTQQSYLLSGLQSGTANRWWFIFYPGHGSYNGLSFRMDNSSQVASPAGTSWQSGTWYHLVGVFTGTTLSIYRDGVLLNTANSGSAVSIDQLLIGAATTVPANVANGQIDDVRIYNYALTPEQIRTVYNNGAVTFK